jgi:hypothetical protein
MATKKKAKTEVKTDNVSIMEMVKNNKPPKLTIVAPPQYEIDWDKIAANVAAAAEVAKTLPYPFPVSETKKAKPKNSEAKAKPKKAKK